MLDKAENQYKNLHFHIPLWYHQEGFMKAYTISAKPSSRAREKVWFEYSMVNLWLKFFGLQNALF